MLEPLKRIPNGAKVKHTFSDQEYAARHAKLRKLMAERRPSTSLLFTSYPQHLLLHRFPLLLLRPAVTACVVTPDKATTVCSNIDAGQPWRRSVADDNLVYTDWQRDNYFRAVQQLIPKRGPARRRVRPSDPRHPAQGSKLRSRRSSSSTSAAARCACGW